MSLILDRNEPEPPVAQTERDNLIQFPPELFGIVRTPWRTWAAAEISSSPAHKRAVAEGRSRRVEANAGDPSDADGFHRENQYDAGNEAAASAIVLGIAGRVPEPWLRAVVTPPLMDSWERAESDSTNGRMHKLIGARKQ